MTRTEIGARIVSRLEPLQDALRSEFSIPGRVGSFVVDNVLPADLARQIYAAFPADSDLVHKKNLGQDKLVGVQMDRYPRILEETVYAFQHPGVVELIARITAIEGLFPDEHLYAGGISVMCKGHYLNPHLDNSHDKDQRNYRALNLLYYVTPDWREEDGGNLELWDRGPRELQRTLTSAFNRLVVMVTNTTSWHSVSPVTAQGRRCCVSNYYFSPQPVDHDTSYHVTSFRGRPGETLKDLAMQGDNLLRTVVKKAVGEKLFKNPHVYKKDGERS